MLARLIEFALTQRLLVLLFMTLLIGGGAYALKEIPIDPLPDFPPPFPGQCGALCGGFEPAWGGIRGRRGWGFP